jgi:hypothetical protein
VARGRFHDAIRSSEGFLYLNLFGGDPYLGDSRGKYGQRMTSFRPTQIQQLAIEAKLNYVLGAHVYDRIFLGFEVLEVVDEELRGWSPTEHLAAVIDVHYSAKVARVAETILNRPIRKVDVLVRGLRHNALMQPL